MDFPFIHQRLPITIEKKIQRYCFSQLIITMGETQVIYAGGGCCTFAIALSALIIACLSFVRVNELRELSTTTTMASSSSAMTSNSGDGPSPTELHGVWQVCGQVNALMVTGEQNDAFDELDIVNLSAYLTYVFRPSTRTPPTNQYLFEGDRCGFTRHASTGVDEPPITYFGADRKVRVSVQ